MSPSYYLEEIFKMMFFFVLYGALELSGASKRLQNGGAWSPRSEVKSGKNNNACYFMKKVGGSAFATPILTPLIMNYIYSRA